MEQERQSRCNVKTPETGAPGRMRLWPKQSPAAGTISTPKANTMEKNLSFLSQSSKK